MIRQHVALHNNGPQFAPGPHFAPGQFAPGHFARRPQFGPGFGRRPRVAPRPQLVPPPNHAQRYESFDFGPMVPTFPKKVSVELPAIGINCSTLGFEVEQPMGLYALRADLNIDNNLDMAAAVVEARKDQVEALISATQHQVVAWAEDNKKTPGELAKLLEALEGRRAEFLSRAAKFTLPSPPLERDPRNRTTAAVAPFSITKAKKPEAKCCCQKQASSAEGVDVQNAKPGELAKDTKTKGKEAEKSQPKGPTEATKTKGNTIEHAEPVEPAKHKKTKVKTIEKPQPEEVVEATKIKGMDAEHAQPEEPAKYTEAKGKNLEYAQPEDFAEGTKTHFKLAFVTEDCIDSDGFENIHTPPTSDEDKDD